MMTKMLREHYNIIAGALHRQKPRANNIGMIYWEEIVKAIGTALIKTNPRFDLDRFCESCRNGVQ